MNKVNSTDGFSMVEVLVAMAVSTIALLGLAAAQLKSLQYATNSFNYTVSLIQANNAIERTWANLCDLQNGNQAYNSDYLDIIVPDANRIKGYTMATVPVVPLPGEPAIAFSNNLNVTVSWTDGRLTENTDAGRAMAIRDNRAEVNAQFPQICFAPPPAV